MKCKKILYSLLFFFFFQSSCIALCLTDKVDFGDSLSKVSEKLKIPPITKSIIGKEGKELAALIQDIAENFNVKSDIVYTSMDQPLGHYAGLWCELK